MQLEEFLEAREMDLKKFFTLNEEDSFMLTYESGEDGGIIIEDRDKNEIAKLSVDEFEELIKELTDFNETLKTTNLNS